MSRGLPSRTGLECLTIGGLNAVGTLGGFYVLLTASNDWNPVGWGLTVLGLVAFAAGVATGSY